MQNLAEDLPREADLEFISVLDAKHRLGRKTDRVAEEYQDLDNWKTS